MRLVERIIEANMPPGVLLTFQQGLEQVLPPGAAEERAWIANIVASTVAPETPPASFEELWPYGQLFITTAIWLAVCDGIYGVEEARIVAALAHKLGFSASELAQMEDDVFTELRARMEQLARR